MIFDRVGTNGKNQKRDVITLQKMLINVGILKYGIKLGELDISNHNDLTIKAIKELNFLCKEKNNEKSYNIKKTDSSFKILQFLNRKITPKVIRLKMISEGGYLICCHIKKENTPRLPDSFKIFLRFKNNNKMIYEKDITGRNLNNILNCEDDFKNILTAIDCASSGENELWSNSTNNESKLDIDIYIKNMNTQNEIGHNFDSDKLKIVMPIKPLIFNEKLDPKIIGTGGDGRKIPYKLNNNCCVLYHKTYIINGKKMIVYINTNKDIPITKYTDLACNCILYVGCCLGVDDDQKLGIGGRPFFDGWRLSAAVDAKFARFHDVTIQECFDNKIIYEMLEANNMHSYIIWNGTHCMLFSNNKFYEFTTPKVTKDPTCGFLETELTVAKNQKKLNRTPYWVSGPVKLRKN
jgi:hypothetical protein